VAFFSLVRETTVDALAERTTANAARLLNPAPSLADGRMRDLHA
jgi:hypothetical protein